MNVCIVSCVFPPEPVVSSKTSAQLAEELVQRGHRVTVIAPFPSRPSGKLYAGYRRRFFQETTHANGFRLIRCLSTLSANSRLASRFFENITFGIASSLALLLSVRKADVVYVNSWPVVATGLIAFACYLRGTPLVISVQDLYPESLTAQKRLSANNPLVRLLRWLDRRIARAGTVLVVISESFRRVYHHDRGVPLQRLHVIPNWEDARPIIPDDPLGRSFRKQLAIPDSAFLVLYAGNVGEAAGVEIIIRSFAAFGRSDDVYLVIAGEGSNLNRCRTIAGEAGGACSERILFHAPWRYEETSMVLSAADLLILPTREGQSLASVPSKIISYMLAARPLIAMVHRDSETADLVKRANCGWVIDPEHAGDLSEKITAARQLDSGLRKRMGLMGRAYALENLSRAVCLPQLTGLLEGVAAKAP